MTRIPIRLVVGDNRPDTLRRRYWGNAKKLLEQCLRTAKRHSQIFTSDPRIVTAFCALHKLGYVNLVILRSNDEREYHVDVDGYIIEPWPDEFFEVDFHLRFSSDTMLQ